MNKAKLTINDLGLALRELGYSPVVSSLESFSVHKDGFNYEVCAGALPTVYLEGSFPFDWFDTDKLYQNRLIAMNMVNAQRDDVTVYLEPGRDEFFFRISFHADSYKSFRDQFEDQRARFELLADEFGRAMELAGRIVKEDDDEESSVRDCGGSPRKQAVCS